MFIHSVQVISLWGRCHNDLHVTEEAEAQRVGATWQRSHSQSDWARIRGLVFGSRVYSFTPPSRDYQGRFCILCSGWGQVLQQTGIRTMKYNVFVPGTGGYSWLLFKSDWFFRGSPQRNRAPKTHYFRIDFKALQSFSTMRYGTCRHPQHKIRIWPHQ